jgi:hypothetical protein
LSARSEAEMLGPEFSRQAVGLSARSEAEMLGMATI